MEDIQKIKYYTPETQEEVLNWIMTEGYLPIKGEAETDGISKYKLSFGEDFKDNLYYLVEFINTQNKTEFNNETCEQSIALELFEIPYLGRQDIEECGFNKEGYDETSLFPIYSKQEYHITKHSSGAYIISKDDKTRASGMYGKNKQYPLFIGFIKNKSEFKKLLKQLRI